MAQDELEQRVSRLEARMDEDSGLPAEVRTVRADAAAARHLAAASDRDVADLHTEVRDFRRATVRNFNAMRDDLGDLRGEMNTRFSEMDSRFAEMDSRFADVNVKLDQTSAGLNQITSMLTTLIDRDEQQGS